MTCWGWMRRTRARRQAGAAVIVAVTVIVLIGFFGGVLMSGIRVANMGSASHFVGTQADFTADAAVEWACQEDSATSAPIVFGGGTFEVSADGDAWACTVADEGTRQTVRCEPEELQGSISNGLDYILGSREWDKEDVEFLLLNATDTPITFNKLKVTWDSPTAYFEEVQVKVKSGTNYGKVWDHDKEPGDIRWGSGETHQFNKKPSVTIPAHYTAEMELEEFKKNPTGGSKRNVRNTEVTIDFYYNAAHVGQIEVGLSPK